MGPKPTPTSVGSSECQDHRKLAILRPNNLVSGTTWYEIYVSSDISSVSIRSKLTSLKVHASCSGLLN